MDWIEVPQDAVQRWAPANTAVFHTCTTAVQLFSHTTWKYFSKTSSRWSYFALWGLQRRGTIFCSQTGIAHEAAVAHIKLTYRHSGRKIKEATTGISHSGW